MKIIGLGETVYDIIFRDNEPQRAVPGGSAYNACITLGRCGVPCVMITEVGDDRVGDIVTQFLSDNGVGVDYVYRHAGTQSHLSLAFLNERNDAEYQFYKMHNALNMPENFPPVEQGDIVLFGSYFAINPKVRSVVSHFLQMAHQCGATIYYDLNFRASHKQDIPNVIDSIRENMSLATVVRGSAEDFNILFDCNDAQQVYTQHIRPLCPLFIYTDADKPVRLFTNRFAAAYPAQPIKTVSTIGAGDNFNAGFCYSLYSAGVSSPEVLRQQDEQSMAQHIATAQRFSSHVCQSFENYVSTEFADAVTHRTSSNIYKAS